MPADSFADLWSSAVPSNKLSQPRKLGDHTPVAEQPRQPQFDTFSLLASPSSNTISRLNTPTISNGQSNGKKTVNPVSNGDAFSSLLSDSFASSKDGTNMTIAERAAKAEREKSELLLKQQQKQKAQASAWSGLDSLDRSSAFSTKLTPSSQPQNDVDWIFDEPPSINSKSPAPLSRTDDDDWGLSDFVSAPAPQTSKNVSKSSLSLWDLDDQPPSLPPRPASRSNSPGDFDFGDREDRLLDDDSNDEDDVLGMLGKPADNLPKRPPPNANTGSLSHSSPVTRSVSPPPHIIGQIVEMGFSPQQARSALAATDTGLNVQTALELLLAENAGPSRSSPPPVRQQRHPRQRSRDRRTEEGEEADYRPRLPKRPMTDSGVSRGREDDDKANDVSKNIQEQADKLLAQASEIGLNMFSKANTFWNQGKEKVQKVYEERKAAAGSETNTATNGRPKWMQNPSNAQVDDGWGDANGFKDDDGYDAQQPNIMLPIDEQRQRRSPSLPPRPQANVNLFEDDGPTAYRSPFRRGLPRQEQPTPSGSSHHLPLRVPSPIQATYRNAVSASASAIATCMKHKATGTEMFKLGRFGEAEIAYTSAIAALPESHLILVQLYNNRAVSRLKTGDHSGTIDDSSAVISLIGSSYHPAREAKVTQEEEGSAVDLADGLMKAYRRRAEAYEGKEKWELAKKDWEIIAGTDWTTSKMRSDAVTGIGRCRKMATADSSSSEPPIPSRTIPKRPPPTSVRRGPTPPSEALNKLRAVNDAADAEDQARHELKDSVEAKIAAWKTGKENNIRALLASLENVLWSSLGWQKVGMHEVVTPAQVKIRYTKAIAKLHPDKLSVNNTTVEQRMIANAVFGCLSDAWNAFKQ